LRLEDFERGHFDGNDPQTGGHEIEIGHIDVFPAGKTLIIAQRPHGW
jgi:hypothetical protein